MLQFLWDHYFKITNLNRQMTILKFYRPEILFPCFAQLISLSGIGPRTATIMEKRIGKYVIDLAFYFPISIINRCVSPDISGIIPTLLWLPGCLAYILYMTLTGPFLIFHR